MGASVRNSLLNHALRLIEVVGLSLLMIRFVVHS